MPAQARYQKRLRVALSAAQREWLDQQASQRGLNASAIVREMVQLAMTADQKPRRAAQ